MSERLDPAPDGGAPPPAPWWSRPGDSAPEARPSLGAEHAPTHVATDVVVDDGGARPAGASVPDPWSPPSAPTGAPAYGAPPPPPYGQAPYGHQPYGRTHDEQPSYGTAAGSGQPSYGTAAGSGQPPYGEAAYGQPGYGTASTPQGGGEPWRQGSYTYAPAYAPGSYREPLPDPLWPTDTVGGPERTRRGLGVAAAVLATALVAGGIGGAVGAAGDRDELLDPSASLGGGTSTTQSVDRPPGSVAGIAAEVLKSTVSIAVRGTSGAGTGSGVVLRSDGYVLTNNHVVQGAENGGRITVTVNASEQELPADIVGLDPETDLAVLKVRGAQLKPAALGQSRALVVGDPVIAIGSPLGLAGTVTTGIVSALNRNPSVPGQNGGRTFLANAIQTDAAINPGNSGGALVDLKGQVVGINSAIATLGGSGAEGGSIGIGFAIPIDEARSIAEEIIRTGRVSHPSIGVTASTVTGGGGRGGARVQAVQPGSAAEQAGLQPGDVVTRVGGERAA